MQRAVLVFQRIYQRVLGIAGTSHLSISCLMLFATDGSVAPSHGCETVALRFVTSLWKMIGEHRPFLIKGFEHVPRILYVVPFIRFLWSVRC
jgi:hypothetical protein